MPRKTKLCAIFWVAAALANSAAALEFQSIKDIATLYESQSTESKKLYLLPDAMPVEILVRLPHLTKIRDAQGATGWVENGNLSEIRTVQVTAPVAYLYEAPDLNSRVLAEITQNVSFYWLDSEQKPWIHVRHLDGTVGYLHIKDIWGI